MEGQLLTLVPSDQPHPLAAAAGAVRKPLGEILCARKAISHAQLTRVLSRQATMSAPIGALLRNEADLDEQDLVSALEDQWGAKRADLSGMPPDTQLIRKLGLDFCLRERLLPWRRIGAVTVIAAVYPERFQRCLPELEARFGPVMLALTTGAELRHCLNRCMPNEIRQRNERRVSAIESCRIWTCLPFRIGALGFIFAVLAGFLSAPVLAFWILTLLALSALVTVTGLKLLAGITALRRPRQDKPSKIVPLHPPSTMRRPVVSLLVPLYREERIADRLLKRLQRLKYPAALLDICLIVEADDTVTRDCLAAIEMPPQFRVITTPHGMIKTKPRAMNHALDHCRGSIVGVYDAEDAPDPDQIALVVSRFAEAPPDVACLQGRLSFYNSRQNWLARCFTIDYAMWFSLVLPGISRMHLPIPLGGTTLFFRKDILERIGAWDAHNVTEDADLGIRLARHGFRTELIDTTTLEEANCRVWPWIRQRSRWMKGYAMTYATHMRRPVRMWRELGTRGFLTVQVVLLGSIIQALLAPALWSWWLMAFGLPHPLREFLSTPALVSIMGLLLLCEGVNIALAVLALRRTGRMGLSGWILAMNPYFMLQTAAALKALSEMAYRPFFWDKTEHGLDDSNSPAAGQPA